VTKQASRQENDQTARQIAAQTIQLFEKNSQFQTLLQAPQDPVNTTLSIDLLSYLNPIHPSLIQLIEQNESDYLHSLSGQEQQALIHRLAKNGATQLVFTDKQQIPATFFLQNKISIHLLSNNSRPAFQHLQEITQHIVIEECSIHGCMVIVFGQGIFITGDSGAGKSTLLLTLLDRGHLWVADDAPLIYRNYSGQVYVSHPAHLSQYIHIENIGVIDVDQTYGKSKRIPHQRLAAIIHLSNNDIIANSDDSIFTGYQLTNVLNQATPKWHISTAQGNTAILVESIARQLILNSWGHNASEALINTHDAAIKA